MKIIQNLLIFNIQMQFKIFSVKSGLLKVKNYYFEIKKKNKNKK
jgi:hypothetical protein